MQKISLDFSHLHSYCRSLEGILIDSFTLNSISKTYLVQQNVYIDSVLEESVASHLGVAVDDEDLYKLFKEYIEDRVC